MNNKFANMPIQRLWHDNNLYQIASFRFANCCNNLSYWSQIFVESIEMEKMIDNITKKKIILGKQEKVKRLGVITKSFDN